MSNTGDNWIEDEVGSPNEFIIGLMKERTPEKARELQEVVDIHRITFSCDGQEERGIFNAQPSTGRITIGVNGSTRIMGHTFAYLSAYFALLEKGKLIQVDNQISASYEERLKAAGQLLTWAVTHDVRSDLPSYARHLVSPYVPEDIVHLVETCLPAEQQELAGELFANALVWILYHEVAHIQNGDAACNSFESIEQEKLADRMAADWMLDSQDISSSDQWKRQAGIAIALGWMTTLDVYLGPGEMTTHPHSYDRLFQIVDRMAEPEQEDLWRFVQMILVLHIQNRQLPIDESRIGTSYRDNCNYLIDIISYL